MRNGFRPAPALLLAAAMALPAAALAAANDCGANAFQIDTSPQHEKRLHDALNLTPQQEGAWQKYVQSLHQQPAGQSGKRADWATLSAPERAQASLDATKRQEEYMTQMVGGMKTFYGTLNPAQQKTFDRFHGGQQSDQR